MKKREIILLINKTSYVNYTLSLISVKSAILYFKGYYETEWDKWKIVGFELVGGTGLSKKAEDTWNQFVSWCHLRGLKSIYHNASEYFLISNGYQEDPYSKYKRKEL